MQFQFFSGDSSPYFTRTGTIFIGLDYVPLYDMKQIWLRFLWHEMEIDIIYQNIEIIFWPNNFGPNALCQSIQMNKTSKIKPFYFQKSE